MATAKRTDVMNPEQFREFMAKREAGRTSKYKAIPTETQDGQKFKSELEARYYGRCLILQKAGQIDKIEREVRYELVVNGVFIASYMMDFRITYSNGSIDYIDCKSDATLTPLYKMKKLLMLALYGIELKEVFAEGESFTDRVKNQEKKKGRKK